MAMNKEAILNIVREKLQNFCFRAIDSEYQNVNTQFEIQCIICGKITSRRIYTILNSNKITCSVCFKNKQNKKIKTILKECGFTIFSGEYNNNKSKCTIQCVLCKQTRKTYFGAILRKTNHTCLNCNIYKYNKDFVTKYLLEKEITLISDYKSVTDNIQVKCIVCEYVWKSTFHNLKNKNTGCSNCAGNKPLTYEYVYNKFQEAGLILLEKKYTNLSTKMLCMCLKCDKQYYKTARGIIHRNVSCNRCRQTRHTLDDVTKYLKNNFNFKLLSNNYTNTKTPLKLQCSNCKEYFTNTFHNIKIKMHRCPYCQQTGGENIVRAYLQKVFGEQFPRKRPKWLQYGQTRRHSLELDGYCKELKLAFEYQGSQHYKYPNHCHTSIKQFKALQDRDKLKKNLCIENNVKLIVIDEFYTYSKIEELRKIILNQLSQKHIALGNWNFETDKHGIVYVTENNNTL